MKVLEFCMGSIFSSLASYTFLGGSSTFFSVFYLSVLDDFLSKGLEVSLVSYAEGLVCYGMAGMDVYSSFLKRGSLFF